MVHKVHFAPKRSRWGWPAYLRKILYPPAIGDGAGFPAGGVGRGHPVAVWRGGPCNVTPRLEAKESYVIA